MHHVLRAPRVFTAFRSILACMLCMLLAAPTQALASSKATPAPTRIPQPTKDPSAEKYDDTRPDALEPGMLTATAAILIEASTGDVIFEKNADEIMYPASTTKVMTAMIVLSAMENMDIPDEVIVSEYAANQPGDASKVPVSADEAIYIEDLLYGTMIESGNDGSVALAEHIAGTEEAFVQIMNDYAAMLQCTNTHFANSHGYHDPNHYSTARDMSTIARAAMEIPKFRDLVNTTDYVLPKTNKHPSRRLSSRNNFINNEIEGNKYYFSDGIGIKTGYHSEAMYCFVGAANRGGVELISVVLHSSDKDRWEDTRRLMEYGFTKFESTTPMEIYLAAPRVFYVNGFDMSDAAHKGEMELGIRPVDPDQDPGYIVGRTEFIDQIRRDFSQLTQFRQERSDRAPITEGDVVGILTYHTRSGERLEYELYATRTIAADPNAPPSLEQIKANTENDPNPLPSFSLEYVLPPALALLLLVQLFRLLRKRRGHTRKQKKRLPKPKHRSYR